MRNHWIYHQGSCYRFCVSPAEWSGVLWAAYVTGKSENAFISTKNKPCSTLGSLCTFDCKELRKSKKQCWAPFALPGPFASVKYKASILDATGQTVTFSFVNPLFAVGAEAALAEFNWKGSPITYSTTKDVPIPFRYGSLQLPNLIPARRSVATNEPESRPKRSKRGKVEARVPVDYTAVAGLFALLEWELALYIVWFMDERSAKAFASSCHAFAAFARRGGRYLNFDAIMSIAVENKTLTKASAVLPWRPFPCVFGALTVRSLEELRCHIEKGHSGFYVCPWLLDGDIPTVVSFVEAVPCNVSVFFWKNYLEYWGGGQNTWFEASRCGSSGKRSNVTFRPSRMFSSQNTPLPSAANAVVVGAERNRMVDKQKIVIDYYSSYFPKFEWNPGVSASWYWHIDHYKNKLYFYGNFYFARVPGEDFEQRPNANCSVIGALYPKHVLTLLECCPNLKRVGYYYPWDKNGKVVIPSFENVDQRIVLLMKMTNNPEKRIQENLVLPDRDEIESMYQQVALSYPNLELVPVRNPYCLGF